MSKNHPKEPKELALEEALKASSKEVISLKRQLKAQEDRIRSLDKEIQGLENVIHVLNMKVRDQEMNFRMEQFLLYARKSERYTRSEIDQMAKLVSRFDEDASEDMGISDEEKAGLPPSSGEAVPAVPEGSGKKPWGRQKDVRTCGRKMDFKDRLEVDERVLDLKAKPGLDPSYAASLTLIRTSERYQIDFVPCHLRTRKTVTYIYSDGQGKVVSLSPDEHDLIQGGKLTNRVIASVINDKMLFGIPLNRTARMLNVMAGFEAVSAALLTSDYLKVASFMKPVYDRMITLSRTGRIAHSDETFLSVVHERETGGRKQGYMWAFMSDSPNRIATYSFYPSRDADCGRKHLGGTTCEALQTDAYAVYAKVVREMNEALARNMEKTEGRPDSEEFLAEAGRLMERGTVLVGCMAHARRRFFRLLATTYSQLPDSEGFQTCTNILNTIAEVYSIEKIYRKRLTAGDITEGEFLKGRRSDAGPAIARLKSYASSRKEVHQHEPKLTEAIGYLLNQIDIIANYLDYPELTPDNNSQERAIRRVDIARATSMFASTSEGAEAWAVLLTILQTAEINKVNPTDYLVYLMDKIASFNQQDTLEKDVDWDSLMPWNLKNKLKAITV